MSLYSQKKKIPSKTLNTKEFLFLKGLQTAVAATDSEDFQLRVPASFRQTFFATSQKYTCSEKTCRGCHSQNLLNYTGISCTRIYTKIYEDIAFFFSRIHK